MYFSDSDVDFWNESLCIDIPYSSPHNTIKNKKNFGWKYWLKYVLPKTYCIKNMIELTSRYENSKYSTPADVCQSFNPFESDIQADTIERNE